MRTIAAVLTAALALAGCKDKDKAPPARPATTDPTPVPPAPPPAPANDGTAEELVAAYQAAHVGATTANVIETGKKLWPLLDDDARAMVTTAANATIGAMATSVQVSTSDLGYKILGEGAAARRDFMANAMLVEDRVEQDRNIAGTIVSTRTLVLRAPGLEPIELVAERAGKDAPWRFAASSGLLVTEQEVFRAPAGGDAPAGVATLDAVAARWAQILKAGTGWDAYNIMSPTMRTKLLDMMASVGGTGAGDVAKVFEKTIVDRRDRGVTVTKTAIENRTADHGSIVMTYSDGKTDTFDGVLVDGTWWLEMPL
jgi:hypothetical protein